MMRPTVTALLAALAQFCSAEPALRGQDLDQQDPGPLPVVRGGDRPVAVPSALASPQEAPDGQRQVALLARGGQVLDQSPRARELQQECGGMVPSGPDEFCGYCVDSDGAFYDGILFYDVPNHEDCLARCPIHRLVGYDYTPVENLCICRYEDGTVARDSCPVGYKDSCLTSIGWIGEGPVTQGNGDSNVACRARRFCGDILFPDESSGEFCGHCVDSNGELYEGIIFYDVPDHEDCFALCPVSDKYVGYEYLLWDPTHRIENMCICRYEDETVVREYCPQGICRNADGTVSGISCPAGYDESNCRMSRSWLGEGPVARGDGDSHVACRTRFADDAALQWAEDEGNRLWSEDLERWLEWLEAHMTGYNTSEMAPDSEFDTWSQELAAEILAGDFEHGHVANPGKLVDIARIARNNHNERNRVRPERVPPISSWNPNGDIDRANPSS